MWQIHHNIYATVGCLPMGLISGRREILCRDSRACTRPKSSWVACDWKERENHWRCEPCSRRCAVPGEAVWGVCAESLGAEHGRMLVQLPADAVLGTQKTLEQLWGSKMFPDAAFYLPFSRLLILRRYLNPHSVFHKNVLARSLSLWWVYWKPALKISINLNIFMMPFYLLSFSTVPSSYFCHFFKLFSAFIKPYSFS